MLLEVVETWVVVNCSIWCLRLMGRIVARDWPNVGGILHSHTRVGLLIESSIEL